MKALYQEDSAADIRFWEEIDGIWRDVGKHYRD
jgi:hypothetical protein